VSYNQRRTHGEILCLGLAPFHPQLASSRSTDDADTGVRSGRPPDDQTRLLPVARMEINLTRPRLIKRSLLAEQRRWALVHAERVWRPIQGEIPRARVEGPLLGQGRPQVVPSEGQRCCQRRREQYRGLPLDGANSTWWSVSTPARSARSPYTVTGCVTTGHPPCHSTLAMNDSRPS
jgi:hypothetical protein